MSFVHVTTLIAEKTGIMFSYFAFGCIYIECACLLIGLYHIVEYYKLYECIPYCIWWCAQYSLQCLKHILVNSVDTPTSSVQHTP